MLYEACRDPTSFAAHGNLYISLANGITCSPAAPMHLLMLRYDLQAPFHLSLQHRDHIVQNTISFNAFMLL